VTRKGAACLDGEGKIGESSTGPVADIATWNLTELQHAGAVNDFVTSRLLCGPLGASDSIIHGPLVDQYQEIVSPKLDESLKRRSSEAHRIQRLDR